MAKTLPLHITSFHTMTAESLDCIDFFQTEEEALNAARSRNHEMTPRGLAVEALGDEYTIERTQFGWVAQWWNGDVEEPKKYLGDIHGFFRQQRT